jgi:nicotinamidase-related amidase
MKDVGVIVFTRDWHPEDHSSFAEGTPEYRDGSWPPHCIAGTHGADIDDWLWNQAVDAVETEDKLVLVVNKGRDKDKEAYSGFEGKVSAVIHPSGGDRDWHEFNGQSLAQALNNLGVRHVKIGGLALDYCVKATAIDSAAHFPDTTVYLNATRPVAYLTGAQAVADLVAKGVRLDSREI